MKHHYKFDESRNEILPGAVKHDNDLAQDNHDFFNLIALLPIISLDVMNWNWEKMFNLKKKQTIIDSWTGKWFDQFFIITALYLIVDMVWILSVPKCVKSPPTIIQHHVFTAIYILYLYSQPDQRWIMGVYMSAQINTWFLIARRVFNKEGFPPWIIDLSFVSIKVKLISICFFVTWFGIRCFLFPILLGYLFKVWRLESAKAKSYYVLSIIPLVLQATMCTLNFKWTFDLLRSKLRYYKRRRNLKGKKRYSSSEGLDKMS